MKVCVSGAECGFRAFQSGDAAAAAVCSVSSVSVAWMRFATVSRTHQKRLQYSKQKEPHTVTYPKTTLFKFQVDEGTKPAGLPPRWLEVSLMAVNLELADTLQKEQIEPVHRGHWSCFSLPFKRSPSTVSCNATLNISRCWHWCMRSS